MDELYHQIVVSLRTLLARILEPKLDLNDFLALVARLAKQLDSDHLEVRVYEVNFIENELFLRTSTHIDVNTLDDREKTFTIQPQTITGDATIQNRVIVASREEGYAKSRFFDGHEVRAAFPIEFIDADMPEGRTKYLMVVDKKDAGAIPAMVLDALKDYAILSGLAISIKELRDTLSLYYEHNRNLVLTGRHSAAIAHDIRSLNIGVGGYVTIALRYLTESSGEDLTKARKYLALALDNSGQVEAFLKNFAQFNRAEIVLNRDTDLLDAVTDKVISLSNRLDFGRLVEFHTILPTEKTGLLVDRDWFGMVIENLVRNSVEACGGQTRIIIRLEKKAEKLTMTYEDNCGGIPTGMLADIFTPFRSSKKKGQGLGLANVKKVVTDHGGTIVVSNHPGLGAVFTISFAGISG